MASALRAISDVAFLQEAWQKISAGRQAKPSYGRVGLDGESLFTFDRRLERNLKYLADDLLPGTYGFSPLEPIFVPKPSGKERLICVPVIRDRIVQRAILNFLRPKNGWMANGVSFGFVPDMSVNRAISAAVEHRTKKRWVFKTDITAFFDRIDRSMLIERLRKKIRYPSLIPLVERAVHCEISTARTSIAEKLKKADIRAGRGVRQGMPLSPYFANVMLEPFDKACKALGNLAVRYADDLVFFAESRDEAIEIQAFCIEHLNSLNLEIPALGVASKTRIYAPDEPAEFLGVELAPYNGTYSIRISREQLSKIKDRVMSFGDLTDLKKRGLDITRFGNALEASLRSYQAAYEFCDNLPDLVQHLENCKIRALEKAMISLGVDIAKLDENARWFLGLSAGRGQ